MKCCYINENVALWVMSTYSCSAYSECLHVCLWVYVNVLPKSFKMYFKFNHNFNSSHKLMITKCISDHETTSLKPPVSIKLLKCILKHLRQFVQSDWFLPVFISHDKDTASSLQIDPFKRRVLFSY